MLRYNVCEGYGFIYCDNYNSDDFVHYTAIIEKPKQILKVFARGEKIKFNIVIDKKYFSKTVT